MSIFSITGLTSGIDYTSLIANIMELERQPIYRLQDRQEVYNKKISAYSTLSSKLSTLKSAAETLKSSSSFYAKSVSSSDSTVVEATVSSSAAVGNYSISISYLAQAEKEVHSGVADTSTVVNSSGSDLVFQYTYAGTQRDITVPDGTTLEGLKNLINDDVDNPGVTATIIYDGSLYRLVLTGNDMGSANTITIDAGTTLDGTNSVDFTSGTFTETKSAQDAVFEIDGVSMTRTSNTITDAIEGVTLTLKKADPTSPPSATISVTDDISGIKSQIEEFVNAYNAVVSYVSENAYYDTDTGESGPLNGESTARKIIDRLRNIIVSGVDSLPEDMKALSQIGITTDYKTGKLTIDSTTLDEKLSSDLEGVFNIFSDATDGIATEIYDYIDGVTDSISGSITLREEALQTLVSDIDDDIEKLEVRLEKMEEDLRRQFASLEALLSGLTTQGTFLLNQLAVWTK
jgi:flagellar hook-associated protein 2